VRGGLVAAGVLSLVGAFAPFSGSHAETKVVQVDVSATPEIYKFITAIASMTAKAPAANGTRPRKYLTIGKKGDEEAFVSSIGVLASDGESPFLPPDTVAVLRVQAEDGCQVPHDNEYLPLQRGISTFIVSHDGENIWEIGIVRGVVSIRLVRSATEFGEWEPYKSDPSGYRTYPCDKYL